MGWQKKILRVDLSKGTCVSEPLDMDLAANYIGQRGLATRYLVNEIDHKVDPLSPKNKLIFATGPLTATMAAASARYSVITKSPLTGGIACSNSGGYFGAELKMAGWDMVIFEGKAKSPVYLYINNDHAELRSADQLWGKNVWQTESMIQEAHNNPQLKVSAIGQGGENKVLFAAIMNDTHRAAGRSGVGAVMGSKNLKAIAVRGTVGVTVRDPKLFMEVANASKKKLADNHETNTSFPVFGTQSLTNLINEVGGLPTRNHQTNRFEGTRNISGEAMHDVRADGTTNFTTNQACFGCNIACGRVSRIESSHYSLKDNPGYSGNSGGVEYESAWSFGAQCGIDDLEACTYANFACNDYGLDTISFGATLSAAMELFEEGVITTKQTGIPLNFGSAEALTTMVELTGRGEGFGKDLGMGSLRLCEKYGRPELSMTVRGQELSAYDPRGIQGIGLAYVTSSRGGCHLRAYTPAAEIKGIPQKMDPLVTEGKANVVRRFEDTLNIVDSSGLCQFTKFAWTVMGDFREHLDAACEGDFSVDNLWLIGGRIQNMERMFNLSAGWDPKGDTLPKRLLNEPVQISEGIEMVSNLKEMLPEYYQLRGWNKNGVPTKKTLKEFGLQEFI